MKMISAVLILFLTTIAVLPVSAAQPKCGYMLVTCPCGMESNQEIEVPIKLCRKFIIENYFPRFKCLPCDAIHPERLCNHFRYCQDCVSNKKSKCINENVDPSKIPSTFCPRPLLLHNGDITVKMESSPGAEMHYACHRTYRLVGNLTRTCSDDFHWSGKPSRCVKHIFCDTPKMPVNGHIVGASNRYTFAYGEIVTYGCNEGFVLIGAARRRCLSTGRWSWSMPVCISVMSCQDPGVPKDATRIDTRPDNSKNNSPFPVGSTLKYICRKGYNLYGSTVRECLAGGKWRGKQPACVVECGKVFKSQAHSIMGGDELPRHLVPWMAGISLFLMTKNDITCGGSLLNERFVVTAAHCVTISRTTDTYSLDKFTVYLGKVYLKNALDDQIVQKFEISDIYVHDDYVPGKLINDVALLYLSRDAVFNEFVRPICLPPNKDTLQSLTESVVPGYVSGWGLTENKTQASKRLTSKVNLFTDKSCLLAFRTIEPDRTERDLETLFCAGTFAVLHGKNTTRICDASKFDSGGGLVFRTSGTYDPTWYLEGIVSWGVKNGIGVYVRVSAVTDWIKSII